MKAAASIFGWLARILALGFIALNGYGWFDESMARQEMPSSGGDWIWQWAILTHFLPLLILVLGFLLGWKRPEVAAIAFGVYSVLQVFSVGDEWGYLPLVVLPPATIALLYAATWWFGSRKTA